LAARLLGSSIWGLPGFGGSIFGSSGASSTTSNPAAAAASASSFSSSLPYLNPLLTSPAASGGSFAAATSFNLGTTASTVAPGNYSFSTDQLFQGMGLGSGIVNTDFHRPAAPPPVIQGTLQTAVGTGQLIGGAGFGVATSWSGVGGAVGGAVAIRGADNIQAGLGTGMHGQVQPTALNQAVTYTTGSPTAGAFADLGADFGTVFVGAAAPRPVSLAPARVSSSTRVVVPNSALESHSIVVGLEPRPIVSQFDTLAASRATSGSSYWWTGRYSTPASQPGAYQASASRVFPTHRNSGLSGQALRLEQEAFATKRLMENNPIGLVRGQAAEAGLTVFGRNAPIGTGGERLADTGAENAIMRAIEAYRVSKVR
jgi:hypothetical protein